MFVSRCPVCDHANPEQSKFCNGCGASLLRTGVCARCGALNEISAAQCHRCESPLLEAAPSEPETGPEGPSRAAIDVEALHRQLLGDKHLAARRPASSLPLSHPSPAIEPPSLAEDTWPMHQPTRRLSRRQRWFITSTTVCVVLGSLAYVTYRQWSVVEVSGLLPPLHTQPVAAVRNGIVNVGAAIPPSMTASEDLTPADAAPQRTAPVLSDDSDAALPATSAGAAKRKPRAEAARTVPDDEPNRPRINSPSPPPAGIGGACTPAVAALGLCSAPPSTHPPAKE